MKFLYKESLDVTVAERWNKIDPAYKKAFFVVLVISFLAYGFEMTNLTLHHDDVAYIFIQDTILGHYLGRFGLGWLNYYAQNAYYMPFLQMFEGIVLMTAYGMLVSRFWGLTKTVDIILVSAVLCVFPYMAHMFSYNVAMATFPVAYLLAAAAVALSARATLISVIIAAILYVLAFSIYQSVIANAATIFVVWILSKLLYREHDIALFSRELVKPVAAALIAVTAGGAMYLAIVSYLSIPFDSYPGAEKVFDIQGGRNLSYILFSILEGSRSFYFWPENYFPDYLKKIQLIFLVGAIAVCAWLPRGLIKKCSALLMLGAAIITPRTLQVLHPQFNYHVLTLTAYAVTIAGLVMLLLRSSVEAIRNISAILVFVLLIGYVMQCNWISTINHLNTLAHYTTMTQILTRIKSLPAEYWLNAKVFVVGHYKMRSDYPFKRATGVATTFVDGPHMNHLARLMREDISFVVADATTPRILEYAAETPPWPHPDSIGIHEGMAIVVLSHGRVDRNRQ